MSRPRIQIFGAKEYETTVKNDLVRQGYTLDVLHDPTEWLKQQEAAKAQAAEQTAADRKKAAEEKAAAEKAALKAEILAELKEAGVIPQSDKKTTGK